MSIFIDEKTPVLVQGITGLIGSFHAKEMIDYGTNVVAGVTPGKGGMTHLGKPVFNTVQEAVEATGAEASIVFVTPAYAGDGIMEAAESGIKYCVSITDGIPTHDMIRVKRYINSAQPDERMILTGPNCAGTISPGKAMMGIMPGHIYMKGKVGLIGRSGTLGYEAASQMKELGIGISTAVGIGGDPINGSSFVEILKHFEKDDETEAVLIIGEIGGPQEAEAADYFKNNMSTNQVLLNSKNALQAAGNAILFGGVIVYPTDTLYGFGVDARNENAIKRLNAIKGRTGPMSVIAPDVNTCL